jgi:hypothetical protein
MGFAGIDRKLIRATAVIAAPIELVALVGMSAADPSRFPWWIAAYGTASLYVHAPAFLLVDALPEVLFFPLMFVIGYVDVFVAILLAAIVVRLTRRFISTQ